ncbi:MAG: biotin synthase BioB [Lentisphaerae bacterium GWF2_52_8]|nr:MAG: biotin synthase BioB [Lentisphaerae bacterium GWF2_52_8]
MRGISASEARELLEEKMGPAKLLSLLQRASELREKRCGNKLDTCSIINAKCGGCTEDCAFCAQSSSSKAEIEKYPLVSVETIFKAAAEASAHGAKNFGIVTSGRIVSERELDDICEAVRRIAASLPIIPCASLGILKEDSLIRLKESGLRRYHHNLETARSYFPQICGTRSYDAQTGTVLAAQKTGLEVCSGGIFGMGESFGQRVELLETLRSLNVTCVPINFLNPIPGTRLEGHCSLSPRDCIKIIAVARLMMPDTGIRVCGGREKNLRDMQSWLFAAGADSLMVGGYLVTPGREVKLDMQMISDAGYSL